MPHKTTLLLNLDETILVALNEEQFFSEHCKTHEGIKKFKNIHSTHQLSVGEQLGNLYIFVINPTKVKEMIETIYQRKDDIIIFTSQLWPIAILTVISSICNLIPKVSAQFLNATILNPQLDKKMLGTALEVTQKLPKGYRLNGLFPVMPQLQQRHFVLLDNDDWHVKSCEDKDYIEAVVATTNKEGMAFYNLVLMLMQFAHADNVKLSPVSALPPKATASI